MSELNVEKPNAKAAFDQACEFDRVGRESEAVKHYELALRDLKSLSDKDQRGLLLGLGSTYRCLGRYEESLAVFDRALESFPNSREFSVFRALTLYNLGQPAKCVEQLLLQLVETTSDPEIRSLERALRFYSDKIEQVWLD